MKTEPKTSSSILNYSEKKDLEDKLFDSCRRIANIYPESLKDFRKEGYPYEHVERLVLRLMRDTIEFLHSKDKLKV